MPKVLKVKKELEYEDAPSGFVTLYNYKEPFMEFKGGFGYEGVLLFDGESDKVQCHMCGGWYDYLPAHIGLHGLRASEYKEEVGLRQNSALISESHREKLIANRAISLRNLIKGKKKTEAEKKRISQTMKKVKRETQNERGTCPYQMLDRIAKLGQELGRTPTTSEFTGYITAVRLYGSWAKAVELAGLRARKPGENVVKRRNVYSKDELITILKSFYKENGRIPIQSDERRFNLPSRETYKRNFGSWPKALSAAKLKNT